jgi:hypothetical protein
MDKIIALRFESLKEISAIKTLMEIGIVDAKTSPGDAQIGRHIIEVLNKCAKNMQEYNEQTR